MSNVSSDSQLLKIKFLVCRVALKGHSNSIKFPALVNYLSRINSFPSQAKRRRSQAFPFPLSQFRFLISWFFIYNKYINNKVFSVFLRISQISTRFPPLFLGWYSFLSCASSFQLPPVSSILPNQNFRSVFNLFIFLFLILIRTLPEAKLKFNSIIILRIIF